MKFFVDTANLDEVKKANEWGILDGVTTNPSLIAKEGVAYKDRVLEICKVVGPGKAVSAEVTEYEFDKMLLRLRTSPPGTKTLRQGPHDPGGHGGHGQAGPEGRPFNCTLIFSSRRP